MLCPQSSVIPAAYFIGFFYQVSGIVVCAIVIAPQSCALTGASSHVFAEISIYSFANYG